MSVGDPLGHRDHGGEKLHSRLEGFEASDRISERLDAGDGHREEGLPVLPELTSFEDGGNYGMVESGQDGPLVLQSGGELEIAKAISPSRGLL